MRFDLPLEKWLFYIFSAHNQHRGRKSNNLGFSQFMLTLEHVARMRGKQVVKINQWEPTSQTCSCCGHRRSICESGCSPVGRVGLKLGGITTPPKISGVKQSRYYWKELGHRLRALRELDSQMRKYPLLGKKYPSGLCSKKR